jgi:hypothetical protein
VIFFNVALLPRMAKVVAKVKEKVKVKAKAKRAKAKYKKKQLLVPALSSGFGVLFPPGCLLMEL